MKKNSPYLCGISQTLESDLALLEVLLSKNAKDPLAHVNDRKAASVPDELECLLSRVARDRAI